MNCRRTVFPLLVFLLSLAGCSNYRVFVQGVDLDHFMPSQTAPMDSRTMKREGAYHNDRGVLLEKEGDLDGALKQYRLARRKDPTLTRAYINAGNVYIKLNQLGQAEELYLQALEREPEQPQALNNLAWVYIIRRKNLPAAIGLLERAIKADRENRYLYLDSLGWALYRKGREEEAISTLKSALEEPPLAENYLRGEAHYHLSLIYHERGEEEAAADHLKKSLELYPSPERAKLGNGE